MRFLMRSSLLACVGFVFWCVVQAADKPSIPLLKFNDVKEIAPGVFFRYSSISATDPKVPFGGCNNIWVVFKDYVAVIDANFPKEAADVIVDIRKTTDKPIRYVFDTHHHGDHAYGNVVWAKEGAKVIASKPAARLLEGRGPEQWMMAAKDRKDIAETQLKIADISFEDKYVLDDGTQRVEFMFLGHAHTPGDGVAYLPKYKLLCTGDACVNGAFNFMGHSNSASWIRVLEKMEKLDVEIICPGHGLPASRELIAKQKRYFTDLRATVQKGIDAKKNVTEIQETIGLDWYKEWTGKAARENKDNIEHVFAELSGKIDHDRLGRLIEPVQWPLRPQLTSTPTSGDAFGR